MQLADPKGLIRESYRIDGISPGECRSIFVDWALSIAAQCDIAQALAHLLATYAPGHPGHPMNAVLTEGLQAPLEPRRRGGRGGRFTS